MSGVDLKWVYHSKSSEGAYARIRLTHIYKEDFKAIYNPGLSHVGVSALWMLYNF